MFAGPWMRHGRRASFFKRGGLKFLILDLVAEKPRHGYEIIREIEEKSGGLYSPSPGTVYPTLQMLEDMGHVRVKEDEGKKVYELTDEGSAYLSEHKERVQEHRERIAQCGPPFLRGEAISIRHQVRDLVHSIMHASMQSRGDTRKTQAIQEVLERTRQDIDKIVAGS